MKGRTGKFRARHSYTFTSLPGSARKVLLCPDCGEALLHEDIEQYPACPYCGRKFKMTKDMEDFILNPFADPWNFSSQRLAPESFLSDEE